MFSLFLKKTAGVVLQFGSDFFFRTKLENDACRSPLYSQNNVPKPVTNLDTFSRRVSRTHMVTVIVITLRVCVTGCVSRRVASFSSETNPSRYKASTKHNVLTCAWHEDQVVRSIHFKLNQFYIYVWLESTMEMVKPGQF